MIKKEIRKAKIVSDEEGALPKPPRKCKYQTVNRVLDI